MAETSFDAIAGSLNSNTPGTAVDITSYTESTPFVCPKSGTVILSMSAATGGATLALHCTNRGIHIISNSYSLFYRDGLIQGETNCFEIPVYKNDSIYPFFNTPVSNTNKCIYIPNGN